MFVCTIYILIKANALCKYRRTQRNANLIKCNSCRWNVMCAVPSSVRMQHNFIAIDGSELLSEWVNGLHYVVGRGTISPGERALLARLHAYSIYINCGVLAICPACVIHCIVRQRICSMFRGCLWCTDASASTRPRVHGTRYGCMGHVNSHHFAAEKLTANHQQPETI